MTMVTGILRRKSYEAMAALGDVVRLQRLPASSSLLVFAKLRAFVIVYSARPLHREIDMASQDASSRLRKAFKYPTENDAADPGSDLDEQEQEKLIQNLAKADAQKTQNYKTAFVTLPLLSIILYVHRLVLPADSNDLLLGVLAVSSLLLTAYILWFIPLQGEKRSPTVVQIPGLGNVDLQAPGPLLPYVFYLNIGLCGILALQGESGDHGEKPEELIWWMFPGGKSFRALTFSVCT